MSIRIVFVITLMIVSFSCKKEEEAPLPIADFFIEIGSCNDSICNVKLYDNSENVVSWEWSIGNEVVSDLENFTIDLVTNNGCQVKLKVKNSDNVEDVKVKAISI
jgi:hypothetical protein